MLGRVTAAATLVLAAAFSTQKPDDRGRPVILLVHGRGMTGRDTAATRTMWLDALIAGAKSVSKASLIAERDVRLVWYADVLDPMSADRCSYAPTDPRARRDATTDPELKSFVSMVGNVLGALTTLVSDSGSTTELRSLSGDASFLSDAHKRCAAERRLADAIDRAGREGRPVIVVAHSLGSLVAYDYLSSRRDSGVVQRVVSIGSPLGSIGASAFAHRRRLHRIVRAAAQRAHLDQRSQRRRSVRDAAVVRPRHPRDDAGRRTRRARDGRLPAHSATAGAILGGWCAAFVGSAPAGCADVPR